MKHTDYFKNFLENTVNLSKFNLDLLSQRVDTVYGVLKADDDLGPLIKKKIPQGSWPQKTIIRPQNGKAFDGDFMVQMVENPEWEDDKKKYGDAIYRVLHNTSPYKDMPHGRKCRCVYLTYANNAMHLDIVPFVIRADGTQWIINRDDNEWERTDTDGFTAWMKRQDEIAGKHLREVIRIMKFLRDHKNSFTGTRSILLTTLLGEQVKEWRTVLDAGYYGDLPTALLHIVSELDDWLQARPTKPTIMDPAGTGTSFDHRWSPETYTYFRDRIHAHAAEIKAAHDETDFDKSVKKWQALFGDGFSAPKTGGAVGKYSALGTGAGFRRRIDGEPAGSRRVNKPRPSAWQRQVLTDLRTITGAYPDDVQIVGCHRLDKAGSMRLRFRLRTQDIQRVDGGIPVGAHEDIIVTVDRSELAPPRAEVEHLRFLHHPHVLQGHALCLYLDPSREWDPLNGFGGFLDRLFTWLADAAAARFDAQTALYHAVGGVLHATHRAPTIVTREPLHQGRRAHHGWLLARTPHRFDLTLVRPAATTKADHTPVVFLDADLPFGAGSSLAEFLYALDNPYLEHPAPDSPYAEQPIRPAPSSMVLTVLGASAIRKADGSPQRLVIAVPHPTGGPPHLLAANIPAVGSDHLRALMRTNKNRSPIIDIDRTELNPDTPLQWTPPSAGVVLHALVRVARPPVGIDGLAVPRIHLCLDELRQSNAEHGQEGPTLVGVVGVGGD